MTALTIAPDFGASVELKPRVNKAQWREGFAQRGVDGINTMPEVWQVTFSLRSASDVYVLLELFRQLGGTQSFDWTSPRGTAGQWVCEEWSYSRENALFSTVTAKFVQVFLSSALNVQLGNDPYFSRVSLLLHFNGTNGSAVFTDSSMNSLTIGTTNGPILSTAVTPKFGSACGFFDTDAYITVPTNNLFNFGTGDLTVEAWIRAASFSGAPCRLLRMNNGTTYDFTFELSGGGGSLTFYGASAGGTTVWNVTTPVNQWNHVAFSRVAGQMYAYFNGVRLGVSYGATANSVNLFCNAPISVGAGFGPTGNLLTPNFYIDDLRITKGVGRYSAASFTLPTAPYPDI